MMSVRVRLAAILARWCLFERKRAPVTTSELVMRVWPTDCDLNMHMNNSRYLALMDAGRWHYLLRTGLAAEVWRRRWAPVAVRVEIDFKKSLAPGERFRLETQTERLGERSVTMHQRFWRGDELAAEARVVCLWRHAGESQAVAPLYEAFPQLLPTAP